MKTIKLDKWKDLPENYTGVVDWDDLIFYYLNGKLHRTDGPAFIWSNGDIEYYLNGKRHREDGPAIIRKDGNMYYINHINITKEVNNWIKENNIPDYKHWNKSDIRLFQETFCYNVTKLERSMFSSIRKFIIDKIDLLFILILSLCLIIG